jgi:hypothetical protein
LILSIGLVVVLIAGIKMKNAGMIARSLSLAALIYTFTLELIKALQLYYNKNKEWENNLEEQIKKIKSDGITKF